MAAAKVIDANMGHFHTAALLLECPLVPSFRRGTHIGAEPDRMVKRHKLHSRTTRDMMRMGRIDLGTLLGRAVPVAIRLVGLWGAGARSRNLHFVRLEPAGIKIYE
jgi:UDP-N-acetylglucosamine enolpyruvyl transferase